MKTNEEIFEQTCKERMLKFDLEAFKRDFPSLYNAIMIAMSQAKDEEEKEGIKYHEAVKRQLILTYKERKMNWISITDILPRHLQQCVFLLNNGNVCVGKCRYFEYGDSELIDVHGEGISYLHTTYRNWDLHNFDKTEHYTVTHFVPVPDVPDVKVFINKFSREER